MLRCLLSIEEWAFGDNVTDMIACSTDENLLRMPSSNATPTCNETLKRFRIYPLSYSALRRFIEALSNLTGPGFHGSHASPPVPTPCFKDLDIRH